MALGNEIILTPEPRGRRLEAVIEGGLYPGTCVMLKSGATPDAGNRLTFVAWNKSAQGVPGAIAVLDYDRLSGRSADDAIPDGQRGFVYYPMAGDELNMLVQDQAGTGATSDFSVGDTLEPEDGTGLLIDVTPSAGGRAGPFECMENYNDMSADTRLHVKATGNYS